MDIQIKISKSALDTAIERVITAINMVEEKNHKLLHSLDSSAPSFQGEAADIFTSSIIEMVFRTQTDVETVKAMCDLFREYCVKMSEADISLANTINSRQQNAQLPCAPCHQ